MSATRTPVKFSGRQAMNTGSSLICLIACWLVGGAQAADGEKLPEPRKVTPGVTSGASPSDAIVLFGGENADAWKSVSGNEPVRWRVENGELVVAPGSGDIQTREAFGDVQLHVEWCPPQLPADKADQDRANSGVFLQDQYEVQVLDTFKNKTYSDGQAGAIYKQYPPLVNASLPAGRWQAYDIVYTAPRFAATARCNRLPASRSCTTAC